MSTSKIILYAAVALLWTTTATIVGALSIDCSDGEERFKNKIQEVS